MILSPCKYCILHQKGQEISEIADGLRYLCIFFNSSAYSFFGSVYFNSGHHDKMWTMETGAIFTCGEKALRCPGKNTEEQSSFLFR